MRSPQLEVEGTVALVNGGARVNVSGSGQAVVASSTRARALRELFAAGPGNTWRRRNASGLHSVLDRGGLTLDLRIGRRSIARLGREARPTLAARFVGLPDLELGWRGLWLGLQAAALGWWRRGRSQ